MLDVSYVFLDGGEPVFSVVDPNSKFIIDLLN